MSTSTSYTDAELSSAVESIIRSSVRYEYDSLGNRKDDTSFGDIQDAASGLFISIPNSPYYVISLARDRLQEAAASLIESIEVMLRYATAIGRNVSPVTKTSSLNNAKSALEALADATAQRTGVYQSLDNIPAYLRFEKNTQKFLDEEGKKVNNKGVVIETPEQARTLIKPAAVSLRASCDELIRKATILMGSIPAFQALDLPARLSQSIMSNASSVLGDSIAALEAMDPVARLTVLKDIVLNVLAARAAVSGFGALEPPTTFLILEGTGYLYTDSTHPATPAALTADLDGGYVVGDAYRYLGFTVDGLYSVSYPPPGSYLASLDLVGVWPREVFTGTTKFTLTRETGNLTYTFSFDLPVASYTAEGFMAEMNSQLGSATTQIAVSLKFSAPRTTQEADVSGAGPTGVTFTAPAGVDLALLGVISGDYLYISDSASAGYRSVYVLTSVSSNVVVGDRLYGSSCDGEIEVELSIGASSTLYPSIGLVPFAADVTSRATLSITDVDAGTTITLGQASGAKATCSRTPAKGIMGDMNVQSYTWVSGANRMEASYAFTPDASMGNMTCRSHPEDPSAISFYLYKGEATVVANGTSAQFELTGDIATAFTYTNKAIIVREANDAGDINNHGVLTYLTSPISTGSVIDVTMQNPLNAAVGDVVLVEVGWDYYSLYGEQRHDFKIVADSKSAQANTYTIIDKVTSATTSKPLPFQVKVDPSVPNYATGGNQPSYFTADIGRDRAVFKSLSTGLDSKVVATSPATNSVHYQFFNTSPISAVGTTRWLQLPSWPARIEVGDILEVYLTSPSTASLVANIDMLDSTSKLIRVDTAIDVDYAASLHFSNDSPVPFVRIRKKVKQNFDVMAAALEAWLAQDVNNTLVYFRQLDSVLNILLASGNPTLAQVNAVTSKLGILNAAVADLSTLLETYSSTTVDEVATLISSFRERGADRAIDVLLEGDFTTFFGLDSDSSSYSGNLQKAIRDVEREDLVVRNDNRVDSANTADASYNDYDPELVMEEAEDIDNVDIPNFGSIDSDLPS